MYIFKILTISLVFMELGQIILKIFSFHIIGKMTVPQGKQIVSSISKYIEEQKVKAFKNRESNDNTKMHLNQRKIYLKHNSRSSFLLLLNGRTISARKPEPIASPACVWYVA